MSKAKKSTFDKVKKGRSYLRNVKDKRLLTLMDMYLNQPIFGYVYWDDGERSACYLEDVYSDGDLILVDRTRRKLKCSPYRFTPHPDAWFGLWCDPFADVDAKLRGDFSFV
jgi:hypothetical protein